MSMTLLSYWRSSCSWRVRIALNFKGSSYETLPVHLVKDGGEQHTEAHRARNPMREIPVLLVDEQPLAQSMAILEYLEEVHPDPALLTSAYMVGAYPCKMGLKRDCRLSASPDRLWRSVSDEETLTPM